MLAVSVILLTDRTAAHAAVVKAGDTVLQPVAGSENIYESVVAFPADATFNILIDELSYGFITFSGNGGVGTVAAGSNANRAAGSYVDKSIGRLATDGNPLWVATGQGGNVLVRVDLSNADGIPRYYIALVPAPDPAILFRESFDLCSWGSDWAKGTTLQPYRGQHGTPSSIPIATLDGTEPTIVNLTAATITGTPPVSSTPDLEPFLRSRDLTGWTLVNICEMAGYVRISSPGLGVLTTPALTALSEPDDVIVEFDVCRFSSDGNIVIAVEGSGAITSAAYNDLIEPGVVYGGSFTQHPDPIYIDVATGIVLNATKEPQWNGVNNLVKYWTHFRLTVTGAAADTRIKWDASGLATASDGRLCLDNVLIRRAPLSSGIDHTLPSDVRIYPTIVAPGSSLNIALPETTGAPWIRIADAAGRTLSSLPVADAAIAAPAQPGIYLLQIQAGGGVIATQRIVVR
jgi:hypothetical protein